MAANDGGGLCGREVARRARETHPEVAIIYVTGGAEHEYAARRVPNSALLGKPFGVTQIVKVVSVLIRLRPQSRSRPPPRDKIIGWPVRQDPAYVEL